MTSNRTVQPRRARLGGWPVAAVVAVPITALLLSAGPAQGLLADTPPTDPVVTSTATATTEPAPTPTETTQPTPTTSETSTSEPNASAPASTDPAPAPAPAAPAPAAPAPAPAAPVPAPAAATVGPGLGGGLTAIATLGVPGVAPTYLPAGTAATGLLPFQTFRVVVQLVNGGPDTASVAPRLEYRPQGAADFTPVPDKAVPGTSIHATEEWLPAKVGTTPAPETTTIAAGDLHLAPPDGVVPSDGRRTSGASTTDPYDVPAGTVTEQEFTVALAIDAAYGTTYELRVTNAGSEIPGLTAARVTVAGTPDEVLSPGQQEGAPVPAPTGTASASALPTYPLLGAAAAPSETGRYALTSSATAPTATVEVTTVGPNGPGTIHDPGSSTTTSQCGVCHETHSAASRNLVKAASTTEQCYTCHSGGVGGADVEAQYALGQPANDPATRSYWSHDTSDPGDHTLDSTNEFQGTLTRHSQCSDCHDPHGAKPSKPVMTSTGWTASGGFTKVSGVAVTNGAAGTVPTYTRLDGMLQPVTAEYQLCFKCHSSYTTLPADVPGKPSQNFTDLAVQFNPANPSYHPIEAAGRNQTQKLADSLAGPSPYKLWNFTTNDTVRCVSCHASNTTGTSTDVAQNAPDATLTVHASTNRGILIRPYENRVLSKAGQPYDAKGSALCLACHMEQPYANQYLPAAAEGTNFAFHGLHLTGISAKGDGGTDIDTPGAGQGNARCAECHFRSHGTTALPSDQEVSGDRLVVFAPDVLPSSKLGGKPTFTKTAAGGTCTLTCHGKDHRAVAYTN